VLATFIVINLAVFLAWQVSFEVPRFEPFMIENFLVSTLHLQHGLVWTVVTAAFSHNDVWHLAINLFVLWSFGSVLERLWGSRVFLGFYLIAAVVASVSHCAVSSILMGADDSSALGASGAVSALLVAYAFHFPRHKILLFGIIPIPAFVGVLAFIGIDIWGLIAQTQGGGLPIGHGAHLGGAAAGAVMYLLYLRPRIQLPPPPRPAPGPTVASLSPDEAHEFERIRRKVESQGPAALNPKEQDFLDRLRARVMASQEPPEA
jgi:membrane associated rhomboid family serine protease